MRWRRAFAGWKSAFLPSENFSHSRVGKQLALLLDLGAAQKHEFGENLFLPVFGSQQMELLHSDYCH